ncbi:MAG TPA: hypothetical protein VFK41_01850 [Nocardioidaceae bacterium]|nr:hypothetical protein [Nocardioidaceae bacterium]
MVIEMGEVEITTGSGVQPTDLAWRVFAELLVDWLLSAPDEGYVIMDLAWPDDPLAGTAPYAQLAIHGHRVRSEAVSNHFLDPLFWLDAGRIAELDRLGWRAPTATMRQGSTNFHRNDRLPEDAGPLARRLVATLRNVYGVPEPCFLEVCGFDGDDAWSEAELLLGMHVVRPRHTK